MPASRNLRRFAQVLSLLLTVFLMYVRSATSASLASSFEIVTGLAESPPDPLGPVTANVLNQISGVTTPTSSIVVHPVSVTLTNSAGVSQSVSGGRREIFVPGPNTPEGLPGSAELDLQANLGLTTPPGLGYVASIDLALLLDSAGASLASPAIAPAVVFTSSVFDIFTSAELPDGLLQNYHLHGVASPGTTFSDVQTTLSGSSFFDIVVSQNLDGSQSWGDLRSLYQTTITASVPEPGTLSSLAVGGVLVGLLFRSCCHSSTNSGRATKRDGRT